jgi:hypothetical protein
VTPNKTSNLKLWITMKREIKIYEFVKNIRLKQGEIIGLHARLMKKRKPIIIVSTT